MYDVPNFQCPKVPSSRMNPDVSKGKLVSMGGSSSSKVSVTQKVQPKVPITQKDAAKATPSAKPSAPTMTHTISQGVSAELCPEPSNT